MDSTAQLAAKVKAVIEEYSQLKPSHGDIRLDTVFDDKQHHYALMQIGWDRNRRIRGNLIYVTLHDEKIWIEYDGMENGIASDLIAAGVESTQIVLAFASESQLSPLHSRGAA